MTGIVKLLNNSSSTFVGDIIGEWNTWYGGSGDFIAWGNFGGGTVELELTPDDTLVLCVEGAKLSDKGLVRFDLNAGFKIRAVLKNATQVPSEVYAQVF